MCTVLVGELYAGDRSPANVVQFVSCSYLLLYAVDSTQHTPSVPTDYSPYYIMSTVAISETDTRHRKQKRLYSRQSNAIVHLVRKADAHNENSAKKILGPVV